MYSSFEKSDRWRIRAALAISWAFIALGSLAGLIAPPVSIVKEVGFLAPTGASITLAAATVAFAGILTNRHRLEWFGGWFGAMGGAMYVVPLWVTALTTTPTAGQHAGFATALICFMATRAITCSAHARKLRIEHFAAQRIKKGHT